jgi:hypothetical protein
MRAAVFLSILALTACGSLERRAVSISHGDDKQRVSALMGSPGDRQFNGNVEVWQYCQTGAGFGYHDYRMIWFRDGRVVAISSYKDRTPGSGCSGAFKPIDWSSAPHE